VRCSICKLPERKRAAVDAALAAGDVSLVAVSVSSGLSKSALQRHSKHLSEPNNRWAECPPPFVIEKPTSEVAVPTKESLLERIEFLWAESLDGLMVSKEAVTMTKPDGSTIELPGDLRARAGFIREARSVLELQGAATGDLIRGQANQIGQVLIVCPAMPAGAQATEFQVIDISPAKR
jgi:hypothetical protein